MEIIPLIRLWDFRQIIPFIIETNVELKESFDTIIQSQMNMVSRESCSHFEILQKYRTEQLALANDEFLELINDQQLLIAVDVRNAFYFDSGCAANISVDDWKRELSFLGSVNKANSEFIWPNYLTDDGDDRIKPYKGGRGYHPNDKDGSEHLKLMQRNPSVSERWNLINGALDVDEMIINLWDYDFVMNNIIEKNSLRYKGLCSIQMPSGDMDFLEAWEVNVCSRRKIEGFKASRIRLAKLRYKIKIIELIGNDRDFLEFLTAEQKRWD